MNKTSSTMLASSLLLASFAHAQVLPGDIAMSGFSTSQFGIATPPAVVGYNVGSFGGAGVGTSQAVLHDPSTFLDFIIGGFGFVGRATITGPGTVSYALITNGIGTAAQMSWDAAGNIIVADAGVDQVRSVDAAGVVTDLSTGAQPWGNSINAGAYDPATGDVVVGASGALYRLASGASTGTPIVSGLGGFVSNVQFSPANGDIIATILTASRLIRVDSAGVVSDLMPPGTVTAPNAVVINNLGNYLVGGTGGDLYEIDQAGNAAIIATNTSPGTNVSGLAYVQVGCFAAPFGAACDGPSGSTAMTLSGDCSVGGTITTTSGNHTAPALGLAVYGLSEIAPALDLGPILGATGCNLYVSPDVLVGGLTNASGVFTGTVTSTAAFAGNRVYVQHAVLEGTDLSSFTSSSAAFIQY